MADLHIKAGSAWKKAKKVHVRVAGAWKPVKKMYVKVGGTWKLVYQNAFTVNLVIAANAQNYNVRNAVLASGWDGVIPVNVAVTVNSGIIVSASSTGIPAMTSGSLPAGSIITLTNNGYIVGRGGNGAAVTWTQPVRGADGGGALVTTTATVITNNGIIGGGGGGGGHGGHGSTGTSYGGAGGGGAGYGTGGAGFFSSGINWGVGGNGTHNVGGRGAAGFSIFEGNPPGGNGGNGGALGTVGSGGISAGGAAGYCLNGAAFTTWLVTGTRLGAIT